MSPFLIIGAALLPAVVLVYHIYRRDKYQPEPASQLWRGAMWGVFSVILAATVEELVMHSGLIGSTPSLANSFAKAFLVAAVPEEFAKALCLYLFLRKNKYFDEYMDGIVYAVAVGMGFAGVENIGYLVDAGDHWLNVSVLRALLAVPGHFMFAVLMGYFFSMWRINGNRSAFLLMLLAPIVAHGIYDTLCFSAGLSPVAAVVVTIGMGFLMHYLRKICSRLIAEQLGRDTGDYDVSAYDRKE